MSTHTPITHSAETAACAHGTCGAPGCAQEAADHARIAEALAWLENQSGEDAPSLAEAAAHAGLSPAHFQRVFTRWTGVSPKQFQQAARFARARALLTARASVLDAALGAGLSGPGRLHDLAITMEAMTPGEIRSGGEGLTLTYGFHPSPFGLALVMVSARGLTGLAFVDSGDENAALADMMARWPAADYAQDPVVTAALMPKIFPQTDHLNLKREQSPLKLLIGGTQFQMQVWRALLDIPCGGLVSYSAIAKAVGSDKAMRAVGSAVGANPISYLIPCHRVLRQSAALGGYHWGLNRKRAILAWEAARIGTLQDPENPSTSAML